MLKQKCSLLLFGEDTTDDSGLHFLCYSVQKSCRGRWKRTGRHCFIISRQVNRYDAGRRRDVGRQFDPVKVIFYWLVYTGKALIQIYYKIVCETTYNY